LHPIRSSFLTNMLLKVGVINHSLYVELLNSINNITRNTIINIHMPAKPIQLKLPLFVMWFASKSNNPKNFVDLAYEIKNSKNIKEARKRLLELDQLHGEKKYLVKANKLCYDIQKLLYVIEDEFHVAERKLSSPLIALNIPIPFSPGDTGLNLAHALGSRLINKISNAIFIKSRRKGFCPLFKNILNDLTSVAQMGKYYEIITSKINKI